MNKASRSTPKRRITRAEVSASFNHSVRNHWTVTNVARPIAFTITPFFYNRGWTANDVTLFRVFLALSGCVSLLFLPLGAYLGGAIFFVCFILDCVDGNIARLRDSATYYGKFIDGLADMLYAVGLTFAVGIGLWLSGADPVYLAIASIVTVVSLGNQYVRTRLSFTREWMVASSGAIEPDVEKSVEKYRKLQFPIAAVFVNGRFFAALLLFVPVVGPKLFLCSLIVIQLIPDLIWLALTMLEANRLLDRPRKSIHLAKNYTSEHEKDSASSGAGN